MATLGHSSVAVTERYAHLRSDLFRPEDLLKLSVNMSREAARWSSSRRTGTEQVPLGAGGVRAS